MIASTSPSTKKRAYPFWERLSFLRKGIHMLNDEQLKELQRLKAYFPFRIVFGVIDQDGKFEAYAKTTMHTANSLSRKGHSVFLLK